MTPGRPGIEARDARRFARFRWTLATGTIALVGLSVPLWLDGGGLPQVPLVAAWQVPSRAEAIAWLVGTVAATGAVALGRGGRWAWLLGGLGFAGLMVGDQDRLQPWAMQFLVIALGTAALGRRRGLGLARWYAVVLYAASGLSKLDAAFADELGPAFLRALGGRLGFDPDGWAPATRAAAALALPGAEILVALLLAVPGGRPLGLVGSVGQHLATILILGPGGLGHSGIVLAWNALMIVENLALFAGPGRDWRPGGGANLAALAVVAVLAVGERSGVIDSWPGHALYASHAEQARLDWPDSLAGRLPSSVPLGPVGADGYRRVDLTTWSRRERGVPLYPQNRVACGMAEALASRHGDPTGPPVRLTLRGRAGLFRSPPRAVVEVRGLRAIARQGDRYLLNAHPASGPGGGPRSGARGMIGPTRRSTAPTRPPEPPAMPEPAEPSATPPTTPPLANFLERLGVRSDEAGRLVVRLGPAHLRSLGIAHGGFIATLLDSVMGRDAGRLAPPDHYVVTAQLNVNFIRPGWEGEVVRAGAQVRHRGRKTAVAQGEVRTDAGALVATGSATFLYLPHSDATRARPDRLDPGPGPPGAADD